MGLPRTADPHPPTLRPFRTLDPFGPTPTQSLRYDFIFHQVFAVTDYTSSAAPVLEDPQQQLVLADAPAPAPSSSSRRVMRRHTV